MSIQLPSVSARTPVRLLACSLLVLLANAASADDGSDFWAFERPQRQAPPELERADWCRQPMDAWVLSGIERAGLEPAAEATRAVLLRRVSIDLTGLPPSAADRTAFLDDASPEAWEKLVDRLLASPAFGERWARPWLDLARYAEDQAHIVGNNESLFYPNAYFYRDWLIGALNEDLPYDEFIRQQLAADHLDASERPNLAALGFIGLGPKYYRRGAPEVQAEEYMDRVDVVGRGLLGLTVACARCHDHKFDPIPTADYYALAGVFASTEMFNRPLPGKEANKNGHAKKANQSMHVVRDQKPRDLHVLVRGQVDKEGDLAPRRFLGVLSDGEPRRFTQGSGRLELAEEIIDPRNPLTARVFVNRIWGQVFGRALVETPSNFGKLGARPSHPELLDDLALRFIDNGWSLRWLLREMTLSATYRQSSLPSDTALDKDPANRWLARAPYKRLSLEAWRDTLLAVGGELDRRIGGPSIDPQKPDETRRTVYSRVSRFELDHLLTLFDFPDPNAHAEDRATTTTPLQKLFVLNSPFLIARARSLAESLQAEDVSASADRGAALRRARIEEAYRRVFGRQPSSVELALGDAYLAPGDDDQAAWTSWAQALLSSSELLYLD